MPQSNKKYAAELKNSTQHIREVVQNCNDFAFKSMVHSDQWSVGEILEHLYRSEYGLASVLNGKTSPPDRAPDEKTALFEKAFIQSDNRYEAPDITLPKGEYTRAELTDKFTRNRNAIIAIIRNPDTDLSLLCTSLEHPVFGLLTRLEWIEFILIHSNRHLKQMKQVANTPSG